MFLELAELLVCPRCRPVQGLIVVVDDIEARRVLEGYLGCPECGARHPIRGGEIHLEAAAPAAADRGGADGGPRPGRSARDRGERGWSAAGEAGAADGESPAAVAALLGPGEEGGCFLLDEALAPLAPGVARLLGDAEVVTLGPGSGGRHQGVTFLRGADARELPIFPGRLHGIGLRGGGRERIREAGRVLRGGARLVVFRPEPPVFEEVRELGFEVLASEARALVAIRGEG